MLEVITREAAAEKGYKKYFTGAACKHGHVCERWVCDGTCFDCKAIRVKKWQQKSRKQLAAYKREYRKQYPDKVLGQEKRYKAHNREASKEKRKKYSADFERKRKLKQEMAAGRKKPNACEICGETGVRICYDHCHQTGLFRGWLCVRCNSTLGLVRDDVNVLAKLAAYLNGFRGAYELYRDRADNRGLLR